MTDLDTIDRERPPSPDEMHIRADLRAEGFVDGLHARKWRDPVLTWPVLQVDVAVGDQAFVRLRLLVDGYPARAPGGQLWDDSRDTALQVDRWPTGGAATKVFRTDWSPANSNAPYLPCDRTGLATHPDWGHTDPDRAWNPSRSIAFYLDEIHGELIEAALPREWSVT